MFAKTGRHRHAMTLSTGTLPVKRNDDASRCNRDWIEREIER